MVFNPFLAKGGWIFWLMIGMWALLIFGDFEWVLISVHLLVQVYENFCQ